MKTPRLEKGSILSGVPNTIIIVYFVHYVLWLNTNKSKKGDKKIILLQIISMMKKPALLSWSISTRTNSLEEEYNGEEVIRKRKKVIRRGLDA